MKATEFTLVTDKGLVAISTNVFWKEYVRCVEAHPELEPVKSALEHIFGYRIKSEVPPAVMNGCREIIMFYKQRAIPGKIHSVIKQYTTKYTPEQRHTMEVKARRDFILANYEGTMQ